MVIMDKTILEIVICRIDIQKNNSALKANLNEKCTDICYSFLSTRFINHFR